MLDHVGQDADVVAALGKRRHAGGADANHIGAQLLVGPRGGIGRIFDAFNGVSSALRLEQHITMAAADLEQPAAVRVLPSMPQGGGNFIELQRGGGGKLTNPDPVTEILNRETEWLINGSPFQVCYPLAQPYKGEPEIWRIKNGGGGWVHPMHFHQEEHRIIEKNGVRYNAVTPVGPDDVFAKEDTIALGPGEEVVIYRNFRTFPTATQAAVGTTAKYVAHCHNLAHEDHTMMFGWEIIGNSRSTTT